MGETQIQRGGENVSTIIPFWFLLPVFVLPFVLIGYFTVLNIMYHVFHVDLEKKYRVTRWFKIGYVILIMVTIFWTLAWHLHVSAYNKYVQGVIERYTAMGFDEEFVRGYVGFYPVWAWGYASVLFITGFYVCVAWIGFYLELRKRRLGITKADVVNMSSALIGLILFITGDSTGIKIIRNFGGLLMAIAFFIAIYRWWKKAGEVIRRRR